MAKSNWTRLDSQVHLLRPIAQNSWITEIVCLVAKKLYTISTSFGMRLGDGTG